MRKYKFYNNTNGIVLSYTRDSVRRTVDVVVKVNSGTLGVSMYEVYPITFIGMDDTLFTAFSTSCSYNATAGTYTLVFPDAEISDADAFKYLFESAEWELRLTQQELNELFNEVYQLTGALVSTPVVDGPMNPILYQGTYANTYQLSATPTLTGNTIASFLVDISGIGTSVVNAVDNAATYTLTIPTTIEAGTKLDMYVTATDSQGWKSSPSKLTLTVVSPYVKKPTVVKPVAGDEVIAVSFDIESSVFATEGLDDVCASTEFVIEDSTGKQVYTKTLQSTTYTATITDANLQRGIAYKIKCRQAGVVLTTPSAWSNYVSFITKDISVKAPSIIAPVSGNEIYQYEVVVAGSAFSMLGGGTDTHAASQYQVLDAAGVVVYDSGEKADALTTITIPEIPNVIVGAAYTIRMRYKGTTYLWSDWSAPVSVTIKSSYVASPTVLTPVEGARLSGLVAMITTSDFATVGGPDTQLAAEYRIFNVGTGTTVATSGELTGSQYFSGYNLSYDRPTETSYVATVQVRHKGAKFGWSTWSTGNTVTLMYDRTGERVDGKATIIGKLGYNWIAVLDAKYRKVSKWTSPSMTEAALPGLRPVPSGSYSTDPNASAAEVLARGNNDPNSSTVNSEYIYSLPNASTNYPIVAAGKISIAGGYASVPNIQTLRYIWVRRSFIDVNDPTAASYPELAFSNWKAGAVPHFWSSTNTATYTNNMKTMFYNSADSSMTRSSDCGVCPVLEIPAYEDRTGERIDNKATIIGRLGENWIAVLDAAYRGNATYSVMDPVYISAGIPLTSGDSYTVTSTSTESTILARKLYDVHSSKWNTDYLNQVQSPYDFPAAKLCYDVMIDGKHAHLPNIQTLAFVLAKRYYIDDNDPTVAANPLNKLGVGVTGSWASSTMGYSNSYVCSVDYIGSVSNSGAKVTNPLKVAPVLEIPLYQDRTGERVDNKATIIGKLGTNWIAWLDAAYRAKNLTWGKYKIDLSDINNISGGYTIAEGRTEAYILAQPCMDPKTSKQNTDYLKTQNTGTDSEGSTGVPAAAHCFGISINGTTAQLPNVQTAAFGSANKAVIDQADPTRVTHTAESMAYIGSYWTSSENSSTMAYDINVAVGATNDGKYLACGVCPVLEIPLWCDDDYQ